MKIRKYKPGKDDQELIRIWQEIGWIDKDEEEEKAVLVFLEDSDSLVAEINEEVEGFACSAPATIRYLKGDLSLQAITAVTVSRVARKQGIASMITSKLIAEGAQQGYLLSGLGMFEQGFYDQLGFGTGSYEHFVSFDPADLQIAVKARTPKRVTVKDWQEAHQARLKMRKIHGNCNLLSANITRAEMKWTEKKGFGLGYYNQQEELTHYLWITPESIEQGPYYISWLVYNSVEEFLELMALIKSLGDQVHLVTMLEPAGIQLQDLIKQPFKARQISNKSKYEKLIRASAFWQMRILSLEACLAKTHLDCNPLRFNLKLSDPITDYLPEDNTWRGIAGDYRITLGSESRAVQGYDENLHTLTASVGAFTRMWLGVRPATGLAYTDQLSGPDVLLEELDRVLRLPVPIKNWDF